MAWCGRSIASDCSRMQSKGASGRREAARPTRFPRCGNVAAACAVISSCAGRSLRPPAAATRTPSPRRRCPRWRPPTPWPHHPVRFSCPHRHLLRFHPLHPALRPQAQTTPRRHFLPFRTGWKRAALRRGHCQKSFLQLIPRFSYMARTKPVPPILAADSRKYRQYLGLSSFPFEPNPEREGSGGQ